LGEIKIFKIKFKNLEEFMNKARHILEGEKEKRREAIIWLADEPERNLARKLKRYIDENFKSIKSVRQLARVFSCHYNTISRVFKQEYKITPAKYLRKLKKEYAELKLKQGAKLKSIAYELGYHPQNLIYLMKNKNKK